jgi:hypothetical protein
MAPTSSSVHLPNGQNLAVTPVFGGLFFKSNDLSIHSSSFPAGWTIILQSEDEIQPEEIKENEESTVPKRHHVHKFTKPTLRSDKIFISSISNPSSNDFKPPASPTRQIAMMLWATLYWYFHQPEPSPFVTTVASKNTPDAGKPKSDWRISVKREGVFRGRHLLHKLERMGLISSEESSVGLNADERSEEGWTEMFVSQRSFWQLSAKLFLFTLTPNTGLLLPGSPYGSRPSSPSLNHDMRVEGHSISIADATEGSNRSSSPSRWAPETPGPFASGSHLPTYFPPPPLQYTISNGVRHPIRPKPPRQGETFYTRFIPSVGQYLSFRVASLNEKPVAYNGPVSLDSEVSKSRTLGQFATPAETSQDEGSVAVKDTTDMSDLELLHKWMNDPRVSHFWGCDGPIANQEKLLRMNLSSKHSFPVIGCWDGRPFGYFEIYWVKEDDIGKRLSQGEVDDWDRGVHVLVGEQEFRGPHRISRWMSALVHWALVADYRTNSVILEPRVDNERYVKSRNSHCSPDSGVARY